MVGWLHLVGNQLSGKIPDELLQLKNLRAITLCDNSLFTINDSLRDFLNARSLGWEACQDCITPCDDLDGDNDIDGADLFILSNNFDPLDLGPIAQGLGRLCQN